MSNIELMGGKLQLYRRGKSSFWWCAASVGGKQRRSTTKKESLQQAQAIAEDWYLTLQGKERAGILGSGNNFRRAADQFLKEYGVITEGQRSPRWVEGHGIRLRLHLIPFFGDLHVSQITAGKVQEYRVHRMTTYNVPNPLSKSTLPPRTKPPSRSTLHDEIVTLRLVLKTAIRHEWLDHLPDLSPPYKTQGKIVHRPWFSPAEYKQLYEATRANARKPSRIHYKWNAEQVHDFVLFMANTGLRPDEAKNLQHRDVMIVDDEQTGEKILEIEVRGKRGIGFCKSTPSAVRPYERLLARPIPEQVETRRQGQLRRKEGGAPPPPPPLETPQPTDPVFHVGSILWVFDRGQYAFSIFFRREKPFPERLLRAALPILAGTPRNAPFHHLPRASPSFSGLRALPLSFPPPAKDRLAPPPSIGAVGW